MYSSRPQKQVFFSEAEPYFWYSAGESINEGALWYNLATGRLFCYDTGEWKVESSEKLTLFRKFYAQAFNLSNVTTTQVVDGLRHREQHVFDAFGYDITIVGQQPKTLFLFHDHLPDKKIDVNYWRSNEELFSLLAAYLDKVDGQEIDEADLKNWIESVG
ncbi:hypothetical protein BH09BAC4_BH09BAC4_34720 [soil metagenome]